MASYYSLLGLYFALSYLLVGDGEVLLGDTGMEGSIYIEDCS